MNIKCINGCAIPVVKKHIIKNDNGTYIYGRQKLNCCPICGALMPKSIDTMRAFFSVFNLHPSLSNAERLIYKAELESAAREAFVTVEKRLRKLSGLDLHGSDLATKALTFTYDQKANTVTDMPLIKINDLATESERNEQNGMRFLLMGFFTGQRNIYQHNNIKSGLSDSIAVVIEASFILHKLDGHSTLKGGEWIRTQESYADIHRKMPKLRDRIRLKCELKLKKVLG